jgi:inorganic phosphate transporter, PiT family
MTTTFFLVVVVILLALIFDFLNGFHDSANSIATVVVTKTLTPGQAVRSDISQTVLCSN